MRRRRDKAEQHSTAWKDKEEEQHSNDTDKTAAHKHVGNSSNTSSLQVPSSVHPSSSTTAVATVSPSTSIFCRRFLSPVDRLFIFLFEPHTMNSEAWASLLPSPTPSPTLSPLSESATSPFAITKRSPFPAFHSLPVVGWIVLTLFAVLVRAMLMSHPYSGEHAPPMYGDYEAQRHWMEVTYNLPTQQWYTYDLQYWGLDYPPLTAYTSYLFACIAQLIEPQMIALNSSRGYESYNSKLYMRYTVLLSDLLCFFPSLCAFILIFYHRHNHKPLTACAMMLFVLTIHPAYLLIDHGHFQYNCIALGLTVYSILAVFKDHDLLATIVFCLALGFKQMTLYYAPVFFVLLLSKSWQKAQGNWIKMWIRVLQLGLCVIATFGVLLLPWLLSDNPISSVKQVLIRLFPVARGIYEDKVSNWWCASALLIKWKTWLTSTQVLTASLLLTLMSFLPSLIHLFHFPSHTNTLYSLALTALSYYLFSFQVHEKTILLPLLPVSLLFLRHPLMVSWLSLVAVFSMYPLMIKDHLQLAYVATLFFFIFIASGMIASIPLRSETFDTDTHLRHDTTNVTTTSNAGPKASTTAHPPNQRVSKWAAQLSRFAPKQYDIYYPYVLRLCIASFITAIAIHVFYIGFPVLFSSASQPLLSRYPDILTYLFVEYSFVHFVGFFIFLYWLQLTNVQAEQADTW